MKVDKEIINSMSVSQWLVVSCLFLARFVIRCQLSGWSHKTTDY